LETELLQGGLVFQQQGRLRRGQGDRLGDEQLLHLHPARGEARLELLEEDALVKRVLVDDQDPLGHLDDEVKVVHLNRLDALRRGAGGAGGRGDRRERLEARRGGRAGRARGGNLGPWRRRRRGEG